MKPLKTLVALGLALSTSTALASPYCPQMLDKSQLEKRYQRLAPIYNSTTTGWIFGSDQFHTDYPLSAMEQTLLTKLVEEFAERGTTLALLMAPPRPVIAGQDVVDATIGQPGQYDVTAQAQAFQTMIAQTREAGALTPDLLALATGDAATRQSYYFSRDTHWSSTGAAHSALALARSLSVGADAYDIANLSAPERFKERGSLSDIVRKVCDLDPDQEQMPLYDYGPYMPQTGGLLGDVAVDAVLLGTSFSDRYKRDQYQVADALSAALGQSVVNLSVSGGGMIGPLETYLLSGQYTKDAPNLLIWEFPATYTLREPQLRQLLGALRAGDRRGQGKDISGTKITVPLQEGMDLIGLDPMGGSPLKLAIKLRHADGTATKLTLKRNKRMAEVADLPLWWLDLSGVPLTDARLEITVKGADGVRVYYPTPT